MFVSLSRYQHLGILTNFAFITLLSKTFTLLTKIVAESPGSVSGTLVRQTIFVNQLNKDVLVHTARKPFETQIVKLPQLQAVVLVRELYTGVSACVREYKRASVRISCVSPRHGVG